MRSALVVLLAAAYVLSASAFLSPSPLLQPSRVVGVLTTTADEIEQLQRTVLGNRRYSSNIDISSGDGSTSSGSVKEEEESPSLFQKVQRSIEIAQKSFASGSDFKQVVADVLAGDYDIDIVNAKIDGLIQSAPVVMFIWKASPFSQKAIRAMKLIIMGSVNNNNDEDIISNVKIVRLDDPWDEGNPMRAELGRRVGRTSVPCIFINGEYVGGYDGGVGEESPGLVDLAFQGKLRSKLEAAGALPQQAKEE